MGSWQLQSLARMRHHSISNKTLGYIGFISSLCCWTYPPTWTFRGLSHPLVSPLKAHRFVDAIPTQLSDLLKHLHLTMPQRRHNWTDKTKNKNKNWQTYAALRKRTKLFSTLWKSQCNPLVFMDFHFFTPNEAEKSDQFNKENTLIGGYRCVSIITCFSICCLLWVAHENLGYAERLEIFHKFLRI